MYHNLPLWVITALPLALAASETADDLADFSLRENRFPSVEERVKLYMSNWYAPPCPGNEDGLIRYSFETKEGSDWRVAKVTGYQNHPVIKNTTSPMEIESIVKADMLLFLEDEIIQNCAIEDFDENEVTDKRQLELSKRIEFRANMRMYCDDVKRLLLTAWNHVQWEREDEEAPPILMQFGDNKDSHVFGAVNVPIIKKFRSSYTDPSDLEKVTSQECYSTPREVMKTIHHNDRFQPIVWKLASSRHFDKLYDVYRKDTMWKDKRDAAIFRGQLTGSREGYDKKSSDEENCLRLKRCRLVYNHANSTLIDASLTSTRNRLPNVLKSEGRPDVTLVTRKIDLRDMLECKGIIMIEGNDVASGLKWALLSQSVVLMPPPKHTSWAMEELLEPWVHYIPLDEMASDVEEKMQWIIDNDAEAQKISERATLWMEDLVFHPDAMEDDRIIQEEIIRRYRAHFMRA
mmetsp:Transcript_49848/g.143475  ORF Transcript_49848/g.143475 Transcript_49848/m.143475 type:complete len:461 (-) Transcript_49848:221-1603(-)